MTFDVHLGPAGNCDKDTFKSLRRLKDVGLNAMEIEFVRQVYMSNKMAKEVGKLAKELGIKLSVHASYYINLNSTNKRKLEESKKRILDSCERANYLHAKYVIFHPGYYSKRSKEETYGNIKKAIKDMQKVIKNKKWDVKLAPETTGKINVFGSLNEILRLSKDTGCGYCIDFAHIFAKNLGRIDYKEVLDKIKVKKFHSHFSGIKYGKKGEKRHLKINAHPPLPPLIKEVIKRKLDIIIICESPDPLGDSLKIKRVLEKAGYSFKK